MSKCIKAVKLSKAEKVMDLFDNIDTFNIECQFVIDFVEDRQNRSVGEWNFDGIIEETAYQVNNIVEIMDNDIPDFIVMEKLSKFFNKLEKE